MRRRCHQEHLLHARSHMPSPDASRGISPGKAASLGRVSCAWQGPPRWIWDFGALAMCDSGKRMTDNVLTQLYKGFKTVFNCPSAAPLSGSGEGSSPRSAMALVDRG
ncbi:unnamed protein product [Merluccius merluccius]